MDDFRTDVKIVKAWKKEDAEALLDEQFKKWEKQIDAVDLGTKEGWHQTEFDDSGWMKTYGRSVPYTLKKQMDEFKFWVDVE